MKKLPVDVSSFSIHPIKYGRWAIRMRWSRGRDGLVYVSSHENREAAEAEVKRLEQGGM